MLGVSGGNRYSGGGWICLSVTGCVTDKHLWKLIHDLRKNVFSLLTSDDDILSYKT
jgi:hypothetical protein